MSTNAQKQVLGPFFDAGQLQAGVKLYHYEAGSVGFGSIKHIWQDRSKSIQLPQPYQGDANGILAFFADGLYKLIICKSSSTGPSSDVLFTWDNFSILDTIQSVFEEGDAVTASSTIQVGPGIWTHVIGGAGISLITGDPPFQWLVFDGETVLTHSASVILPGARNRTFKAGDVGFFLNEGNNVWRLAMHLQSEGAYDGRQGSGYAATATLAVPADGDFVDIGGTDIDVAGVATKPAGYHFTARFTGSGCQLLHSATLLCPNANDYRMITNEVIEFRSMGAGIWLVAFRSGPTALPGQVISGIFVTADDGFYLPLGTAIVCTRHQALAKRLIPQTPQLGTTGTSVGTVTFVNGTDTWTRSAHGLVNGDLVHLTNAGGGLPSGFTISTPYYVINAETDTFQLSLTRDGSTVDGTTNGTGTHTIHNKVQLPDPRGCAVTVRDNLGGVAKNRVTSASTSGANASLLAGVFGAQEHVLTIGEIPGDDGHASTSVSLGKQITNSTPAAAAGHSNTQPSMAFGAQIRW